MAVSSTSCNRSDKLAKPLLSVVVRHLPPSMSEEQVKDMLAPLPEHDYFFYLAADSSWDDQAHSMVYIHLCDEGELQLFTDRFDAYMCVDERGNEFELLVEYAPYTITPKFNKQKKNNKEGSIFQDKDYLNFLEQAKSMSIKTASGASQIDKYLQEMEAKQKLLQENNGVLKVTTPLIDYIQRRRDEKKAARDRAKQDRKKKEDQRRKQKDDDKRRRKDEERLRRLDEAERRREERGDGVEMWERDEEGQRESDKALKRDDQSHRKHRDTYRSKRYSEGRKHEERGDSATYEDWERKSDEPQQRGERREKRRDRKERRGMPDEMREKKRGNRQDGKARASGRHPRTERSDWRGDDQQPSEKPGVEDRDKENINRLEGESRMERSGDVDAVDVSSGTVASTSHATKHSGGSANQRWNRKMKTDFNEESDEKSREKRNSGDTSQTGDTVHVKKSERGEGTGGSGRVRNKDRPSRELYQPRQRTKKKDENRTGEGGGGGGRNYRKERVFDRDDERVTEHGEEQDGRESGGKSRYFVRGGRGGGRGGGATAREKRGTYKGRESWDEEKSYRSRDKVQE